MRALERLAFALFLVAAVGAAVVAGGVEVLARDPTAGMSAAACAGPRRLALTLALAAALAGAWLARRWRRRFAFATALALALAVVTLGLGELAAGPFVPPWPARGLHGVAPSDVGGWGLRGARQPGAVGVNSWGQRDRERAVEPAAGVHRVVVIGDSFLEESSVVPLPAAVEERLGRADVEVVNLGVSATGPDEYYWRLRRIGFRLRPCHVAVVLYAGNDFVPSPSLPSLLGVVAPYPRPSLLGAVGLGNLNHVLVNRRRQVLRAWRGAGELEAREAELARRLRQSSDADMPGLLAELAPPADRDALRSFLASRDLAPFYEGLRHPDGELFRSYYLRAALASWGPPRDAGVRVARGPEREVAALVEAMALACRERGVGFTLVVAPEASQVDPRFREFWGRVSHLAQARASTRVLADLLVQDARSRGLEALDLHPVLDGLPGAYYNLDGHWSETGVAAAAEALARWLAARLPAGSERSAVGDRRAAPPLARVGAGGGRRDRALTAQARTR